MQTNNMSFQVSVNSMEMTPTPEFAYPVIEELGQEGIWEVSDANILNSIDGLCSHVQIMLELMEEFADSDSLNFPESLQVKLLSNDKSTGDEIELGSFDFDANLGKLLDSGGAKIDFMPGVFFEDDGQEKVLLDVRMCNLDYMFLDDEIKDVIQIKVQGLSNVSLGELGFANPVVNPGSPESKKIPQPGVSFNISLKVGQTPRKSEGNSDDVLDAQII